ncbi:NAD(P)H-dependent oxidoreductase [Haloferula chungangensis]|uniref:NAD(P)H-dependent oxidoreductase n=1 Tax=Haloferula chungangensis TaxID=1048331 RepID=A0ABW2L1Z8_9BACT
MHQEPEIPDLRIALFLGHPRSDSFCGALAMAYAEGASGAGAALRIFHLGDGEFSQDLITSSPNDQDLEPMLEQCKDAIDWADHLVFVFPTWWATMPATLKGFLDRVLLPGFAFEVNPHAPSGYSPLLTGKSAHLITTMDSPAWVYRWMYGRPGDRAMKGGILGFCGIKPVTSTWISRVKHLSVPEREREIEKVRQLGGQSRIKYQQLVRRRTFAAWLRAVRLQFYGMTLLSYALGALAALRWTEATLSWPALLSGFVALFLIEFGSVLYNEIHDRKTDHLNAHAGPFTGGSRVLVDGSLTVDQLRRIAQVALGVAALLFIFLLGMMALQGLSPTWLACAAGFLFSAYIVGPGYTAPPFRFVYRGFGEMIVAFSHGPFMLVCGWLALGAPLDDSRPWLLSLPIFFSVLGAITLAGIPDADADRQADKNTLAVQLSTDGAAWVAATASGIAVVLLPILDQMLMPDDGLWMKMLIPIAIHFSILLVLISRYQKSGAGCRRIDSILFTALSLILWFSIVPLLELC